MYKQVRIANTYACKKAIKISNPVRATINASGSTPPMPRATTKPAKTLSNVWHASIFANSRTDKLIGRERNEIISKIKDERFVYFGKRLIYQNSPKSLNPNEYKKIHSDIAKKILSTEETRWTTIPMAESLIDNIRNEKDISDEKLNYMNKVDEYIQQIRVFYEKAS